MQHRSFERPTVIEDFDYSYLDNCATSTKAPFMYDITETDPAAAKVKLNEALSAIAIDIKKWAKDAGEAHGVQSVDADGNVLYEAPFIED